MLIDFSFSLLLEFINQYFLNFIWFPFGKPWLSHFSKWVPSFCLIFFSFFLLFSNSEKFALDITKYLNLSAHWDLKEFSIIMENVVSLKIIRRNMNYLSSYMLRLLNIFETENCFVYNKRGAKHYIWDKRCFSKDWNVQIISTNISFQICWIRPYNIEQ